MAAHYDPPSFSLGFDFGFESELQSAPPDDPVDAELDPPVGPQIASPPPPPPPRALKRGLPTTPFRIVKDDIEEFSSPEETTVKDVNRSAQYQTSCSSSKVPLRGSGVLTSQSYNHSIGRNKKLSSHLPASVSLEAGCEFVFPKLTTSPLRRFEFIDCDSDADDPSASHSVSQINSNVGSSSKKNHSSSGYAATTRGTVKNTSMSMPEDVDLWKSFSPIKKINIPTPALDEACQEYFQSVNNRTTQNLEREAYLHTIPNGREFKQTWSDTDPLPPCHCYFFHDDQSIRKLVSSRLPNFFPLGAVSVNGGQQYGASVIDYMGQFSNGKAPKQTVNRRQNISNISNVEEALDESGNWVNPKGKATQRAGAKRSVNKGKNKSVKSNTGSKENAPGNWVETRISSTKKRIQANAQSSGEWVMPSQTGQASQQSGGRWYVSDGRKVYVSKTGKELTGTTAYRTYKKESGKQSAKPSKRKAKK